MDDASIFRLFQVGDGEFRRNEHGTEVRSHDLVPLCNRDVLRPAGDVDAGVVDEDVQPAEVTNGSLNQSFDLRFIRDICLDENRLSTEFFESLRRSAW